ncbi:MAG: tail fiber domain-containing protein [Saprospiraceae bacterium]|nr:tail fiber domain-containing protein [Saprospiraceae bacterium]
MKNLLQTIVFLLIAAASFAQAPQGFKYQAVARNSDTSPMPNQDLGIRATILMGDQAGIPVYSERHTSTTNSLGVFHLNIGEGNTINGNFSAIEWGANDYFLKIDMDAAGGTQYQNIGVTQLLSVPYAMYATKAGSVEGDNDTDSQNEIQTLSYDPATQQLSLSNGGSVTLPTSTTYAPGSGITLNGNTISADDVSATNELQQLSLSGNNLSLSNGGGNVTLPTGTTYTAGNGININGNAISADDVSATNELQQLSLSGNSLSLSNGGGSVSLSGFTPVWNKSGSNAYFNSGNIGIKTSSPNTILHVNGTGVDNNGVTAVVRIVSGNGAQNLLMDGNEIDATADDLYLNNNTAENVILANGGGKVGIGTSNPGVYALRINHPTEGLGLTRTSTNNTWELRTALDNDLDLYYNGSYQGNFVDGSGQYVANSDRRLKKDFEPMTDVLSKVMKLEAMKYHFLKESDEDLKSLGFMAQDVAPYFPELAYLNKRDDGSEYYVMNYAALSVVAVAAVQEQQQIIEGQQKGIADMRQELADLKAIIEKLVSATASK